MSREVTFSAADYVGARPLYFLIFSNDQLGFAVNTVTRSLEPFTTGNWSSYSIALSLAGGVYAGDFPFIPDGRYFVKVYEKVGSSPAPSDNDLAASGFFSYRGTTAQENSEQLAIDARALFAEFGEPATYNQGGDGGTPLSIQIIVNRNPATVVTEDGKVLADDLEINILNDAAAGVTKIVPDRDTIVVSGRFGGIPTSHLVTLVVSGDAGMWTVRAK
jgi:hypothetical protein